MIISILPAVVATSVDDWKKKLMQDFKTIGLIQEEHQPGDSAPKCFMMAVALQVTKTIKNDEIDYN